MRQPDDHPYDALGAERPTAFISHSSSDAAKARRLAARLREADIDVWIDAERIRFGDSVPGKIADGLAASDVILVLVTRAFSKSSWCWAEYEPLLVQEINDRRTIVIPLLLEDVKVPVLLNAKRYVDLRADLEQELVELFDAGRWHAQQKRVLRLLPAEPSTEGSLLALIIGSTLDEFPVAALDDDHLLSGHRLVDLYRAVARLVTRFQEICDEVIPLLALTRGRLREEGAWERVAAANRRLLSTAEDMRAAAQQVAAMLDRASDLRRRLLDVSKICVGISDMEFEYLELTLGVPVDLPSAGHPWLDHGDMGGWHGLLWAPVVRDSSGGRHPEIPPEPQLEELRRTQARLDAYVRDLRAAVARAMAGEQTSLGPRPQD